MSRDQTNFLNEPKEFPTEKGDDLIFAYTVWGSKLFSESAAKHIGELSESENILQNMLKTKRTAQLIDT